MIYLHNTKFKILLISIIIIYILVLPAFSSTYILHLFILAAIGVILSLGLNIFLGYCGQIHFGCAAFYAIGSYASIIFQSKVGLGFFAALLFSVVLSGVIAYLISIPLLRLRGPTLALGTVAFALVIYRLAVAWKSLTGGGDGISSPPLMWFGNVLGDVFFYYFALLVVILCVLFCYSLETCKHGYAMKAIRDNEEAAAALGINAGWYWRTAFIMTGLFCGLAGAIYAPYLGWIDPERFNIITNVTILLMVVVGGVGSLIGAIIGGMMIQLLPELLTGAREYHVIAYGLVLIFVLMFMPMGIGGFLKGVGLRFTKKWNNRLLTEQK